MAFDCVPSTISQVYWKYTHNDIKVKLRLYLGKEQAIVIQNYQTLGKVVSEAFGEGSKTQNDNVIVPQNEHEMQMAFNNVFGK